jgi:tetratricopeptide (TPR) repeat protein
MRGPGRGADRTDRSDPSDFPPARTVALRTLVLIALGSAGCFLFQKEVGQLRYDESHASPEEVAGASAAADSLFAPPRTPDRVEKSFDRAMASISPSNGFKGLWQAARAAAWLAENLPDASGREDWARRGVAAGREAQARAPGQVESWYYTAIALGRLSDILQSPKFVQEMARSAEQALRLDERFDRAGPDRFLGVLNYSTEGKLFVGYGDLDVALKHLKRAVELFPDDAENRAAYGEALIADEEYGEARAQLQAALAAKPAPGEDEKDFQEAQAHARDLLKKIEGK